MRIQLSNPKKFFEQILKKKGLNLINFAKILEVNYSTLKKYRRGELTLTKDIFSKIIKYSPNKENWEKNIKELQDGWGNSMGGRISASKVNCIKKMQYARKFKKITKVKINLNEVFCEFYGILLGDGCISKYKAYDGIERFVIAISGNKKLDSVYLKELKEKIKKEYNLHSYYYEYKDKNVCNLIIRNKKFCLELNKKFKFPIGLKYKKLLISSKILNLNWDIKKFVIRGLFDTDGSIFARKDEEYKYPHIVITSKNIYLLNQIKTLLRGRGYPAHINGNDVRIKGISNAKLWFSDIGSSNQRNLIKYNYFLKRGYLPANIWACSPMVKTRPSHG